MSNRTLEQINEELRRRGVPVDDSDISVMDPNRGKKGGALKEAGRLAESTAKGVGKGVVSLLGGWGNLYDYFANSKEPSALSSTGIVNAINKATGIDLNRIPGYSGAYEVGQAAAPAVIFNAAGMGLFRPTVMGAAGDAAVSAGTGMVANTLAPDSPLGQLAINSLPGMAKGAFGATQNKAIRPIGEMPPRQTVDELTRVGPMTPGEMTGNRLQLSREAGAEASPRSGMLPKQFRQQQASSLESFLTQLFDRTAPGTSGTIGTQVAVEAFSNYGKSLSGKLKRDARVDFNLAKNLGGRIDTTPVMDVVERQLAQIPPEVAELSGLRSALQRIKDEYLIPGTPASVTPSTILGPTGKPATVNVTAAVPDEIAKIDIDRLQKNLAAWGEAAWSGKADFGKGNIFEGVAPGQAKGIARQVLGGFKTALDEAINNNIPGAAQLQRARDNFKNNLQQIDEWANRPLTKYFDVGSPSELVPEKVIQKLADAPPSQKDFLASVLSSHPDGWMVFQEVRRQMFDDVLAKSKNVGARENDPKFLIQAAQKELGKKDLSFLFPDPADRAKAQTALQWMAKVLNSEAVEKAGGVGGGDIYAGVRSAGGSAEAALGAREVFQFMRHTLATPEAIAGVVFTPNAVAELVKIQNRSKGKATLAAGAKTLEVLTKYAAKAGPRMQTEDQVVETEEQQAVPEGTGLPLGYTAEDLEAEIKRRQERGELN